jgi:transposase
MALFWLSDEAFEPHLPRNQPGARRGDDRRVISDILHVLKVGCWCDCPTDYGPSTTVYNRFNRWSRRGFWLKSLEALVHGGAVARNTAIDSTYVKAQLAAFGAKGREQSAVRAVDGPLDGPQRVHALTDIIGRPYALMLRPGNVSDVRPRPRASNRLSSTCSQGGPKPGRRSCGGCGRCLQEGDNTRLSVGRGHVGYCG